MGESITQEDAVRTLAVAILDLIQAVQATNNSRLLTDIRCVASSMRESAVQMAGHVEAHAPVEARPLLLNSREAAKCLSISTGTLYNLTAPRGPIPSVKLGARVCYAVSDLERAIEAHKVKPRSIS